MPKFYKKTASDKKKQNFTKNNQPNTERPKLYETTPSDKTIQNSSSLDQLKAGWPKFDDILLDMGKRYDWKNDRWLRVKVIPINMTKTTSKRQKKDENNININQKHIFIYKLIKLKNTSKIRSNVVVAVSALR